jgi:hypothetical protein
MSNLSNVFSEAVANLNVVETLMPSPNPSQGQRIIYGVAYSMAAFCCGAMSVTLFGTFHSFLLKLIGFAGLFATFILLAGAASWLFA